MLCWIFHVCKGIRRQSQHLSRGVANLGAIGSLWHHKRLLFQRCVLYFEWRMDKSRFLAEFAERHLVKGFFFFNVFCKNTGQHDLCLACTPAISGFPLERVFSISIPALIKKLLYSRGLRELAGSLLSSSVSGRHSAFGNQMSSLLPGWGLSSNFIVVTEWLSPSGKHLILSSASAPLLICFGQVTQFAFNGVSPPVEIFFFIFLCTQQQQQQASHFWCR